MQLLLYELTNPCHSAVSSLSLHLCLLWTVSFCDHSLLTNYPENYPGKEYIFILCCKVIPQHPLQVTRCEQRESMALWFVWVGWVLCSLYLKNQCLSFLITRVNSTFNLKGFSLVNLSLVLAPLYLFIFIISRRSTSPSSFLPSFLPRDLWCLGIFCGYLILRYFSSSDFD